MSITMRLLKLPAYGYMNSVSHGRVTCEPSKVNGVSTLNLQVWFWYCRVATRGQSICLKILSFGFTFLFWKYVFFKIESKY